MFQIAACFQDNVPFPDRNQELIHYSNQSHTLASESRNLDFYGMLDPHIFGFEGGCPFTNMKNAKPFVEAWSPLTSKQVFFACVCGTHGSDQILFYKRMKKNKRVPLGDTSYRICHCVFPIKITFPT